MGELIESVKRYKRARNLKDRAIAATAIILFLGPELKRYVANHCPAEHRDDVIQETFIAIAKNLKSFRGRTDAEFRGWCYQILKRKMWRILKRKGAVLETLDEDSTRSEMEAVAMEISLGTKADLEYAFGLLDKVKLKCRRLLWGRHVLGMDYRSMALELRSTADAIRVEVNRCLALAQELISKHA